MARNRISKYELNDELRLGIETTSSDLNQHIGNTNTHIQMGERDKWNDASEDSGWINIAPTNSWSLGTGGKLRYRRVGHIGAISGEVVNAGTGYTVSIATLPAGFRASSPHIFLGEGSTTKTVRMSTNSSGGVFVGPEHTTGLAGQTLYFHTTFMID